MVWNGITAEFAGWAEKAPSGTGGTLEEAELLLELTRNHLGIDDPRDIRPGDLEELLLRIYPRKVTVLHREDLGDVIPTVRDLLHFLGDSGRVPAARLEKLEQAVDRIEPRFADAVMDPSRWGPARAMTQAMAEDGVDVADPDAVDRWITRYNQRLGAGGAFGSAFDGSGFDGSGFDGSGFDDGGSDDDFDDFDDDLVDLKEALDLPDRLPPLRLPSEAQLAAAARGVELIGQARRLASWVAEHPRTLQAAELTAADAVSAAQAVGLEIPMREPSDTAFPGRPARPDIRQMADLPRLVLLWGLAEGLELIELTDTSARIGPAVAEWADATDQDVLDRWIYALAHTISRPLPGRAEPAGPWDVDENGMGAILLIMLFLERGDGMPVAEIRDILEKGVTEALPTDVADKARRSWTAKHGDPAEVLLEAWTDLGAIAVDGETARLTPLSLYATRLQLIDAGVEVALLPPHEEMTAADLVEVAITATEDELAAESAQWLQRRTPEAAVDELLDVAVDGGPEDRMMAVSLAMREGVVAEGRWRRALDQPSLRPYAKIALAEFAGAEPGDLVPGLEPTLADLAWLATDTIAGTADVMEPGELSQQIKMMVPPGQERLIFEQIWRLDHPDAHEVLVTIGRHHPDKAVAKAARKAAYKNRTSAHKA